MARVQADIRDLRGVFEQAAAKEKERVWQAGRTDGDLDDARLVEALTGDEAVYRRPGKCCAAPDGRVGLGGVGLVGGTLL